VAALAVSAHILRAAGSLAADLTESREEANADQ